MIYYVVQGPFQAILTSWGSLGPWNDPKNVEIFRKSNPNPLPVAQNGPKYVSKSVLSHLEVIWQSDPPKMSPKT